MGLIKKSSIKKSVKFILAFMIIILGNSSYSFAQPSFIFGKQFGTDKDDSGQGIVAYKSGDFVLAGTTFGNLCTNDLGKGDGFIIKYDSTGNEIWKKQFGTKEKDRVWELEKDARDNLYAAGNTNGTVNRKRFGDQDMIVYKFDKNGDLLKSVILGTDSTDYLSRIYIDENMNIYIAGNTKGKLGNNSFGDWDYFIMKLDSNFNEIFTYQFGTDKRDYCRDFKIDNKGNFFICGHTMGNLGSKNIGLTDAFVAKYSKEGKQLKIWQFGTDQYDEANCLSIDKNENIYLAGTTFGKVASENKGKEDVFLMKLDKDWKIIWKKQYGTPSWDEAWSLELIKSDTELLVSGSSNPDAYLRLYDTNGNLEWNEVFAARGIKGGTGGRHFAVYKNKYIYFTGFTFSDLFSKNPNQQTDDAFIVKLGL
jgi:hypothetical protein